MQSVIRNHCLSECEVSECEVSECVNEDSFMNWGVCILKNFGIVNLELQIKVPL